MPLKQDINFDRITKMYNNNYNNNAKFYNIDK